MSPGAAGRPAWASRAPGVWRGSLPRVAAGANCRWCGYGKIAAGARPRRFAPRYAARRARRTVVCVRAREPMDARRMVAGALACDYEGDSPGDAAWGITSPPASARSSRVSIGSPSKFAKDARGNPDCGRPRACGQFGSMGLPAGKVAAEDPVFGPSISATGLLWHPDAASIRAAHRMALPDGTSSGYRSRAGPWSGARMRAWHHSTTIRRRQVSTRAWLPERRFRLHDSGHWRDSSSPSSSGAWCVSHCSSFMVNGYSSSSPRRAKACRVMASRRSRSFQRFSYRSLSLAQAFGRSVSTQARVSCSFAIRGVAHTARQPLVGAFSHPPSGLTALEKFVEVECRRWPLCFRTGERRERSSQHRLVVVIPRLLEVTNEAGVRATWASRRRRDTRLQPTPPQRAPAARGLWLAAIHQPTPLRSIQVISEQTTSGFCVFEDPCLAPHEVLLDGGFHSGRFSRRVPRPCPQQYLCLSSNQAGQSFQLRRRRYCWPEKRMATTHGNLWRCGRQRRHGQAVPLSLRPRVTCITLPKGHLQPNQLIAHWAFSCAAENVAGHTIQVRLNLVRLQHPRDADRAPYR